jgi:hypothetical protein
MCCGTAEVGDMRHEMAKGGDHRQTESEATRWAQACVFGYLVRTKLKQCEPLYLKMLEVMQLKLEMSIWNSSR